MKPFRLPNAGASPALPVGEAGRSPEGPREVAYEWDILRGTLRWGPTLEAVLGHAAGAGPWSLARWEALVHPHDAALVDASLVDALESEGDAWRAEYRLRRGDGAYALVRDEGRIVRDGHGRAVRVVGSLRTLASGGA